jgi:hypothetical protein
LHIDNVSHGKLARLVGEKILSIFENQTL